MKAWIALLALVISPAAQSETVYKHVDENGKVTYTNRQIQNLKPSHSIEVLEMEDEYRESEPVIPKRSEPRPKRQESQARMIDREGKKIRTNQDSIVCKERWSDYLKSAGDHFELKKSDRAQKMYKRYKKAGC